MASEKNLNLKKETVKTIVDKINASETVILFTYQGLTVADISGLRRKLREDETEVKIYKNSLVKRAFDELNVDMDEFLTGPNAILFSKKLLEGIKVLSDFAKSNKNLDIRAGIIKGDVVTVDTIKDYANIPSMEGLLTMLAGGMMDHVKNLSISLKLYAEDLNDGKPLDAPKVEEAAPVQEEVTPEPEEVTETTEAPVAEEAPTEEVVEETTPEVTEETPTPEAEVTEETPTEEVETPSEETKEEN
jgi:large subunit ribosomal protein L10